MTGKNPSSIHTNNSLPHTEGKACGDLPRIPETLTSQEAPLMCHAPDVSAHPRESRYRLIIESLADYLYSSHLDNGGTVESIQGRACQKVTGYTTDEFSAEPLLWINMVAPEDRTLVQDRVQRILTGEEVPPIEYRIQRKDGALRWVRDMTITFKDAAGNLLSYDGVIKDITEQKHTEQSLRDSEERYRTLVDSANDGIVLQDSFGRILTWNKEAERIFGVRAEDVLGKKPTDSDWKAFHEDGTDFPCAEHPAMLTLATGTVYRNVVMRVVRPDNDFSWININTSPIYKEGNIKPSEVVAIFSDITDRILTQDALRKSTESYLRQFTDNAAAMLMIDPDSGQILDVNAAAENFYVLSRDRLLAMNISEMDTGSVGEIQQRMNAIACEHGEKFEAQHRLADGSIRDVDIFASSIQFGERRILHLIVHDITEHKQTEKALRIVAESDASPENDIFRFLVRHLALSLNKRYAMIARIDTGKKAMVHTIALWNSGGLAESRKQFGYFATEVNVWSSGGFVDNFSYALEDSPCWNLVKQGTCFFPRNIQILFPQNRLLKEMGVESYWGISLRDATGTVMGLLAVLDDKPMDESPQILSLLNSFAARASSEMDRRRSGEKYQTLFNEMIDGFALHEILCDEAGHPVNYRFLLVNPAFERMTGLRAADIIDKTVLEVIPVLEKDWIEIYGRVALTGEPVHFENYAQAIGRYFEITAFQAQRNQFACIFVDVTKRKRAEDAIRSMQGLLNETQRLTKVGGWEFRVDNNQITWTDTAYDIFEVSRNEEPNQFLDTLKFYAPEDRVRINHAFLDALTKGEPYDLELKIMTAQNRTRWVRTTGCVEKTGDNVSRVYGNIMDITERKSAQEERERLEDQLRQSQKMEAVGLLAGGVAHDFNNMLQVILCNAEVLKDAVEQNSVYGEVLAEVRQAAERAADLTRQLLAFSRRQIICPANLDMNELIHGVLKMIRRIIGEHIDLIFIPGNRLGVVYADKGQIEQILMNLCVNARDAMPNGGMLTIETEVVVVDDVFHRTHSWATEGRYVLLSVTDTGCGMDAVTSAQIFDPFFTTKEVGQGTGLGLATVYGVVKQHNGMIQVYSEPGKGTAFKIYIPIVERSAENVGTKIEAPAIGGTETILVAEDEAMVRNLVSHMLESDGYTVLMAHDGEEALRVFKEYADEIDLALLDVMMPKLGGREAMEAIKAQYPRVRFLFSSGYSENAAHTNFVIQKGLRLISKPYHRKALLDAVREVLDAPPSE